MALAAIGSMLHETSGRLLAQRAHRLSKILAAESLDLLHVQVVGDAEAALAGWLARIPGIIGTYHMNTRRTEHTGGFRRS